MRPQTIESDVTLDSSLGVLLRFFLPLAGTSFLIIITHTIFNAGLARLPEPEVALASFALAKSIVHIIENPIGMFRQTVVAMTEGQESYGTVCHFIYLLLLLITCLLGLTAYTPIGAWFLRTLMGIEGEILRGTLIAMRVLIILPVVSGLRNLYQGVAILLRRTPLVTGATATRVLFVVVTVFLLPYFGHWPGAALGAIMFAGGIAIECAVLFSGVKRVAPDTGTRIQGMHPGRDDPGVSYRALGRFFLPLGVTSLVRTLILPTVNAGLARAADPEVALSVFAVAWGFGNIWLAPINMMFHQCSLIFVEEGDEDAGRNVKRFALLIAGAMTLVLGVFALTPAGTWVLTGIIGVSTDLARGAQLVLLVMCLLPSVSIGREYIWGRLMDQGRTGSMGLGKVANFVAVLLAVFVLAIVFGGATALTGVLALTSGAVAEFAVVYHYGRKRGGAPVARTGGV